MGTHPGHFPFEEPKIAAGDSSLVAHLQKIRCQSAFIRPALPEDSIAIQAMHQRLSKESLYLRYLRPYQPSQKDIEQIIGKDGAAGPARALVAVAAHDPARVVGLAYYAPDPLDPHAAEPAVVVEDSWQSCGIGKALLEKLGYLAAANGIEVFKAMVLPANARILHMARQNPKLKKIHYEDGLMAVETALPAA